MSILDGSSLSDDKFCFACGRENPHGLKMRISYPDGQAHCLITLPRERQGWAGIIHGGVVYTLMDEVMAHAVIHQVGFAVTVGAEIKYRSPVMVDTELLVRGWVEEVNGRKVLAAADVAPSAGGKPLAQATGAFILQKS
jgi:acyl-coenzyme A thioesterase PaaI-like protein